VWRLAAGWHGREARVCRRLVQLHSTDDSLTWRSQGQVLGLHSGGNKGIVVTKTSPAVLWGLQQGDVILAVNEQPVKHVNELLDRLYTSKPAAVKIRLRRESAEQALTIAAADYTNIVNPTPPSGG
jgi:S1-C subfamily serine protease